MFTVSLHPDQFITYKVRDNVYYSTIKRAYQTFHGRKNFSVYNNGKWYLANIIMREVIEHPIYRIECESEIVLCDEFLKVFINGKEINVKELKTGDIIDVNSINCDKIKCHKDGKLKITNIRETEEKSNWLFGIEFKDETDNSFVLTNGIIVK